MVMLKLSLTPRSCLCEYHRFSVLTIAISRSLHNISFFTRRKEGRNLADDFILSLFHNFVGLRLRSIEKKEEGIGKKKGIGHDTATSMSYSLRSETQIAFLFF